MKEQLKKLVALVASVLMALAVVTPAYAASITINSDSMTSDTDNTTYTAYKVLDVTKAASGDGVAYTVSKDSLWLAVLQGCSQLSVTATANGQAYNVTLANGVEDNDATAMKIASYLNERIPTGVMGTQLVVGQTASVDDGYYLVKSTLGSSLVLATTDIAITEKNDYPSLTKTEDKQNLQTGDTVTYTLTVHVPESANVGGTITVHDTLDSRLSANLNSISGKLGTGADATNVTLDNATANAGETFAKSFTITSDMLDKDVVITYSAELKSDADANTEYKNSAFLNYANFQTKPSEVSVKTFDFDFTKTFADSTEKSGLKANFELRTSASDSGTAISFVKDSTGYVIADSDDANNSPTITAFDDVPVNVRGLQQGTYYLVETGTAAGYNPLANAIKVEVAADGTATLTNGDANSTGSITVENQTGSTLPTTGGMGTTLFTVVGAALVVAAGVLLVTRRRMQQ